MCSSLWKYFSWKKSFLVISGILRPFFNTLTLDDNFFLGNRENLPQPIQMQLSRKLQIFSPFFTAFLRDTLNFENLEKKKKKMSLVAYVFPKL